MLKLSKKKIRIGILGGTFDPPHLGHVYISKIGIKKFKLDKLLWVITKKNPLKKKPFLNIKMRLKLSKEITRKEKKIFVKYFNNKIKTNNTFDLLNYLKSKNNNSKIYFLIGSDNLIKFHKWKNWKEIPKLAKLVVFARPNHTYKALNSVSSKTLKRNDWIYVNSRKINISSSLIRKFW